ncbi:MAG: hypothetical protein AAGF46_01145, partial [Pseudomonadota bacterium]
GRSNGSKLVQFFLAGSPRRCVRVWAVAHQAMGHVPLGPIVSGDGPPKRFEYTSQAVERFAHCAAVSDGVCSIAIQYSDQVRACDAARSVDKSLQGGTH